MEYIDIAIKAARQAGTIHKKYFQTDIKVGTKSSSYDLVTVADIEAEKAVVSVIKEHCPDHNFLTEEERYAVTSSDYTWVIDPLDGTNNFACGLPIFCVSIALVKNDEVIVAAVYDVTRDELFSAEKNKGAFLNGSRIKVTPVDSLQQALFITGFYYDRGEDMIQALDTIKRFFLKHIMGLRRLGAAALDLCYVASGRVSGFWEFELSPWDFAAGKLLIEEAGGKITDRKGNPVPLRDKSFIVASNGKIHEQMLQIILF